MKNDKLTLSILAMCANKPPYRFGDLSEKAIIDDFEEEESHALETVKLGTVLLGKGAR